MAQCLHCSTYRWRNDHISGCVYSVSVCENNRGSSMDRNKINRNLLILSFYLQVFIINSSDAWPYLSQQQATPKLSLVWRPSRIVSAWLIVFTEQEFQGFQNIDRLVLHIHHSSDRIQYYTIDKIIPVIGYIIIPVIGYQIILVIGYIIIPVIKYSI